jgi:hypothetical protein
MKLDVGYELDCYVEEHAGRRNLVMRKRLGAKTHYLNLPAAVLPALCDLLDELCAAEEQLAAMGSRDTGDTE